jgi:serine/threonine protein kinase
LVSVSRIIAGKYCLLQQLGQGAMGSVWAAEHLTLRSQVAIKLIQRKALEVPNVLQRFEREARALATLRSPHVVQVLDYGVDEDTPYLVMELLNGETLRARLAAQIRLQALEVYTIARHVARAMTVSHAAGFVHRDLKPENVFLTRDDDELIAKVLDFGITKALASGTTNYTEAGLMLGTCHYMSPEQAKGGSVDSRSDLWSLGVMVFECLTGTLPFVGNTVFGAISAVCNAPIVMPSEVARVPVGFDSWFARAVCRDVSKRFQSAQELASALRPVLEEPAEWVGQDRDTHAGTSDGETMRVDAFPTSPAERRREVRVSSSIPAAIDGRRDFPHTALVYNTSRSGALLATQRAWKPNQALVLRLHVDSPIEGELVSAEVVRSSARDDPYWKFEVAVRFREPLSEELLTRIEAKVKGSVA